MYLHVRGEREKYGIVNHPLNDDSRWISPKGCALHELPVSVANSDKLGWTTGGYFDFWSPLKPDCTRWELCDI